MELFAFLAACFVIWKVVDSLSSKTENKHTVSKTTTIHDDGDNRSVHTIVNETFVSGSAHSSINISNIPSGMSDADITGMKTVEPHESMRIESEKRPTEKIDRPWIKTAKSMGRDPSIQSSYNGRSESIQSRSPARIEAIRKPMTVKRCGKCGKAKPAVSEFFRSSKQPDGFSAWCRSCHDEKDKGSRHHKRCPKCGNNRLRTNFGESDRNPDGLTKWCLPCLKKHNRKH